MPVIFLILFGLTALFQLFTLKRKTTLGSKCFSLLLGGSCTILSLILIILLLSFPTRNEGPNISLTLTGCVQEEVVEWKPPYEELRREKLTTYQVLILSPSVNKNVFFFGEVLGVRMKTLELHPVLQWIGFANPTRIECLYSDYVTPSKVAVYPSKKVELTPSTTWSLWEMLFYKKGSKWGVTNAKLTTDYIPLVTPSSTPLLGTFSFPRS